MSASLQGISETKYAEWRRLSASVMRRERRQITLSPTALLHEALLRLPGEDTRTADGSTKPILLTIMRHLLIDRARKRSVVRKHQEQSGVPELTVQPVADRYLIQEAIRRLAQLDERQAAIVELKILAGLSIEEIAERFGCSSRTVSRDWITAKLWLQRELRRS